MSQEEGEGSSRRPPAEEQDPFWRYEEEPFGHKFRRKFSEYPGVYVGFLGGIGMLTYAIWNYRRRRAIPGQRIKATDMYILQNRIIIQGTVVGCILGSYVYHAVRSNFFQDSESDGAKK